MKKNIYSVLVVSMLFITLGFSIVSATADKLSVRISSDKTMLWTPDTYYIGEVDASFSIANANSPGKRVQSRGALIMQLNNNERYSVELDPSSNTIIRQFDENVIAVDQWAEIRTMINGQRATKYTTVQWTIFPRTGYVTITIVNWNKGKPMAIVMRNPVFYGNENQGFLVP